LELIVVVVAVGVLTVFFFMQAVTMAALERDDWSKRAINAMYFVLEDINFARDGFYPEVLNEDTLRGFDPEFFTDPFGMNIGMEGSVFTYEPSNCTDGECQHYVLRAVLEREAEFVRRSRN